ncbi:MAG: biotin--[acetyl-CoA-carboxylase] ligase [Bacilli bacterium]|nr:biotin--[acetyl-CoA-carboxylase] ligase [Bacilli bacterium]
MKHLHFNEIDSTNTYLKQEYQNLDNLTFVTASFQSSGHGRNSRVWNANKEENVLLSYLIKDKDIIEHFSYVSMFSAVVIVKYLESKGLENVSIKWPNDVYVNGKKIAGILLEGAYPNYLIVGIGLNLNQTDFNNKELRHPATSLKLEKSDFNSNPLNESQEIISLFNHLWCDFKGDWLMYDDFIKEHNYLLKKRIKLIDGSRIIIGIVEDIDSQCNLLINIDKEIVKIDSGEIVEIL